MEGRMEVYILYIVTPQADLLVVVVIVIVVVVNGMFFGLEDSIT